MTNTDQEYYRRREAQERDTAERCADTSARRAHLDMANRYSELAQPEPNRQGMPL